MGRGRAKTQIEDNSASLRGKGKAITSLEGLVANTAQRRDKSTELYYQAGLRTEEVQEWLKSNIQPEQAIQFIRAGVPPTQAKERLRQAVGLQDLADIKSWKQKGY